MNKKELKKLIGKAKLGDKKAIEELYRESEKSNYFICSKFLRNEQDVLDIMQDIFITTFTKLDTLKDEENYFGWQKAIAINKCKNYLMKNKEVLFNSDEEAEGGIEIRDTDEEFIPESYIDNKAKRDIVMNILEKELSDVQRMVVLLFYYEDKKISEIATLLECSEGTVKSRLNSAKKLIKDAVNKEEKKGNKLYSIAPIPVLALLLKESAEQCKVPSTVRNGVIEGIKSQLINSNGASLISKITSTFKGMTTINLVVTGVICASLIGGAGYTIINTVNSDDDKVLVNGELADYKTTSCGVNYIEIKELKEAYEIDNSKFSDEYSVDNVKYLEVKDGILHSTIEMDLEDEEIVYTTLKMLKDTLGLINKEKFEDGKISGIEFIVKGKKNSWLMDTDDKLFKIKIKK